MDYVTLLTEYLRNLKPSQYGYILPLYDRAKLDEMASSGFFPSIHGLSKSLIVAAILGISRLLLTHAVIKPFAVWVLGISYHIQEVNPGLDSLLKSKGSAKKVKGSDVAKFCRERKTSTAIGTGCNKRVLTESAANDYLWNVRHNSSVDKKIVKFVEAFWRFLFYGYFCFVGYRALFVPNTVSWVIDTREHWQNWPTQEVTSAIEYYYQIELGAYIHQGMWTEVTRSDSIEMAIHHLATILLIVGSYLTNFTRIGASILLLHDCSDVFLESAKVFNYISKAKGGKWACTVCDCLFAVFAISFMITRLIVYPRYLVYSLIYEAPAILGPWPGYPLFAGLLIVLQGLHIFWFYLILRMIPSLLSTGIQKDERSDDEAEADIVKPRDRDDQDTNEKVPAKKDKQIPNLTNRCKS